MGPRSSQGRAQSFPDLVLKPGDDLINAVELAATGLNISRSSFAAANDHSCANSNQ